ncbi:MAG: hypothetical protein AAF223_16560, partial [Bacteroidota bacterium]
PAHPINPAGRVPTPEMANRAEAWAVCQSACSVVEAETSTRNKTPSRLHRITFGGRKRWQATEEYQRQVAEIKEEVAGQYTLLLLSEKSWLKRLIIKGKRNIEIRRRIAKLDSDKNLHLASTPTWNRI